MNTKFYALALCAIATTAASAQSGNFGIGTNTPGNKLEIKSIAANTSGLRFTNLNNASPTTANSTALGVNSLGDVVTIPVFSGAEAMYNANIGGSYDATSSTPTIIPGTSNNFTASSTGPTLISYCFGYDLYVVAGGPAVTTVNDLIGDYVQFEVYVDGLPVGIQIKQQIITNTGGNCNVMGTVNLTAGAHTIDLRGSRTSDVDVNRDAGFGFQGGTFSLYRIK